MNNSIEIVLVLYQCSLEDSVTFQSLIKQIQTLTLDYELVIYNNDVGNTVFDSRFVVVNSTDNHMLSGAYNFALNRAIENNKKWILLLDQDTIIPNDYFIEIEKFFSTDYTNDLVAVVPILVSNGNILSPKIITSNMRFEHDIIKTGYTNERINAFNSMSLFRVNFIKSLGGFTIDFPLDHHDHWCYHQIFKLKKYIYILNLKAEHNSSFIDFEKNISESRYKRFLKSENKFVKNELGLKVYLLYKVKLFLRSIKQIINYKNKKIAKITFWSIFDSH